MQTTVYAIFGAPRAWRILPGLMFKGIDYDIHLFQASKKEHKKPRYLKPHPRGTVLTVFADNLILRDSLGTLAWLDREFSMHLYLERRLLMQPTSGKLCSNLDAWKTLICQIPGYQKTTPMHW